MEGGVEDGKRWLPYSVRILGNLRKEAYTHAACCKIFVERLSEFANSIRHGTHSQFE